MKNLLYFSASWCGGCKITSPIINKLILEGLPIRKVDVGSEQALAQQYGIMSLPNFIVLDGKQVKDQMTGVQSEERIRELLK